MTCPDCHALLALVQTSLDGGEVQDVRGNRAYKNRVPQDRWYECPRCEATWQRRGRGKFERISEPDLLFIVGCVQRGWVPEEEDNDAIGVQ